MISTLADDESTASFQNVMYTSGNWLCTKSHEYKKSNLVTDQHNITYFNIIHSSTPRYRTWPHPFISSE